MTKHTAVKIFLSVLIIICFVCVCYKSLDNQKSTTLKDAYNIGYNEVYKKNAKVLLVSIGSTDSKLSKEENYAGNNGKRNSWNLIFAVPNSTENWIVTIRDKKIKDIEKTTGIIYDRDDLIDTKDISIDSNKALKIAKKKYVLRHGEVWAIGYHYSLSKEGEDVILQVICRDDENNFTKISIDTKTKKITDAIHKISIGGGIFDGNTNKALVDKYDIDGITNITDSSTVVAWGKKMINIVQYEPVVLYKGNDDKVWNELTFQEDIKNIYPLAESDFLIICEQNIYRYNSNNLSSIFLTEEPILNSFFIRISYIF